MKDITRAAYRTVFGSYEGQKVLAHLLTNLGYFDDNADTSLRMFANQLMAIMGFTDTPDKVEQFIEKCFEIQQDRKETE